MHDAGLRSAAYAYGTNFVWGLRSFARIFSPALFSHECTFFFYRVQKSSSMTTYQPQRLIYTRHTRSKRLESKTKCFCPNITCFLPEYDYLKNPGGCSPQPPPPPPPPCTPMVSRSFLLGHRAWYPARTKRLLISQLNMIMSTFLSCWHSSLGDTCGLCAAIAEDP